MLNYPALSTTVPSAVPTVSLTSTRTVGGAGPVALFDLVTIDAAGELELATAIQPSSQYEVTGVVQASGAIGASLEVVEIQGLTTAMNFASAPLASENGMPVFLSTTSGQATMTPPSTSGRIVFRVGILAGGDGVSLSPSVIWRPRFVSWVP